MNKLIAEPALYVGSIVEDHGDYLAYGPDKYGKYTLTRNDGTKHLLNVDRDSFVINAK